jgi:membrane protein
MKRFFNLFKDAGKDFMADSAPRLGASVAFYTIFSISPLFIIVIALLTFFMHDSTAARDQIYEQISGLVGPKGAETIQSIINQPESEKHGIIATIIAVVTLLLGSTGVFMELQQALNRIWEVEVKGGGGIWGFVKHRLLSFAMVLTIGFLLLVSLILTAGISALGKYVGSYIPAFEAISQILNFVASFGVITVLFALMFKYMPDVRMPWKDVWIGAAMTSLLFAVGKLGLGMYLAKPTTANAFGAAGSLVVVLLWVYYSAQILFFGAEITQVYAKQRGSKVVPTKHAKLKEEGEQRKEPATKRSNPSPKPAAVPDHRPQPAMARKPGFVLPGLVLLLAIILPKAGRHG